jgi:hypothetical protein
MIFDDCSKVVICPYCGEKKELMSLVSGNTFGVKIWSDMKRIAPMLSRVSPVQKCPKCGKYYLEYKQKSEKGKRESSERGELSYWEWKEAYMQFCSNGEEKTITERKFLLFKKERVIKIDADLDETDWNNMRMWLIQAFNDNYYRVGPYGLPTIAKPPKEEYDFIAGIINDFIGKFDWQSANNPLLKAELYREAGEFDKCEETLQSINRMDLSSFERLVYDDIKERKDAGDVKVFRILDERERMGKRKW